MGRRGRLCSALSLTISWFVRHKVVEKVRVWKGWMAVLRKSFMASELMIKAFLFSSRERYSDLYLSGTTSGARSAGMER